ncbi:hypothetical protein K504DRAFT_457553 [Pleomassaria siparia CBS 279.74]|uniref:Uncharacterized protein n=1 Tax=Pleomassaria siparia CBS 279.74 TaxID=1314801 RepID=A0A6G1KRY8_9PLEO|nr:hypothetical protein K504DRAFT_457553 [Pleomassaria siparia CBS 279.74]
MKDSRLYTAGGLLLDPGASGARTAIPNPHDTPFHVAWTWQQKTMRLLSIPTTRVLVKNGNRSWWRSRGFHLLVVPLSKFPGRHTSSVHTLSQTCCMVQTWTKGLITATTVAE